MKSQFDQNAYLDLVEKTLLNALQPENGARIEFLLGLAVNGGAGLDRNELLARLVGLHRETAVRQALDDLNHPKHWWTNTLGFPFTMVCEKRLRNVRTLTEAVIRDGVPGALVETGVWRGGCCIMMKAVNFAHGERRGVYVCDSFEGLPKVTEGVDSNLKLDENPMLTAPLEDVRNHFERFDLLDDEVHFIKGWFHDTMPVLAENDPQEIAVLRLDGDYYSSTMDVLQALYPKVRPGGYVIIDDYNAYEECKLAVTEYRVAHGIDAEIIDIDGIGVYWQI